MAGLARLDFHRAISERFIEAFDAAMRDGRCPWHSRQGHLHLPRDLVSGRAHTGVNILALWGEAVLQGYDAGTSGTERAWRAAGARILRDERPALLIGCRRVTRDRAGVPARVLIQPCPTFLVEQTDRYTPNFCDDPPCMTEIIVACDAWLAGSGARIVYSGARGRYDGRHDLIHLPHRIHFRDTRASSQVEAFYATAFRGLGHWATARGRSHCNLVARFGDEAPAASHLAAELFAAFACARFGIRNAPRPDLARHAASWRDLFRRDRRALFETAAMASAALRSVDGLRAAWLNRARSSAADLAR